MSTAPSTEVSIEEEWMLCPCCFYQNITDVAFCKDCGAPLGCFVGLDPMQQIYLEGFAYRRATGGPPSWKVLAGIWITWLPVFVCLSLWLSMTMGPPGEYFIPADLFMVPPTILFAGTLLYQTTVNYMRKAKLMLSEPPEEEASPTP